MKIVYNSAHVQIETFTFTFSQQGIIVPTSEKLLCQTQNINVQADYFLAKNVRLNINSQQTINRLWPSTDLLLLLVVLVQICHMKHAKEAHSHNWCHAIVSSSEKQ